ncbi:MAG TPA: hypothetical protein PK470_07670, partial [Candidatus Omnitrophota bacterium]|nr:hypothetical protein [Candidatus Omnitrophota bacterium]
PGGLVGGVAVVPGWRLDNIYPPSQKTPGSPGGDCGRGTRSSAAGMFARMGRSQAIPQGKLLIGM